MESPTAVTLLRICVDLGTAAFELMTRAERRRFVAGEPIGFHAAIRSTGALQVGPHPELGQGCQDAYSTINARADTVATKPAFRSAFKKRRCLVLADRP